MAGRPGRKEKLGTATKKAVLTPRTVSKSREDDSWVTFTRLAQMAGLSTATLQKYRRQYEDFPKCHPETQRYEFKGYEKWRKEHPELDKTGGQITGRRADLLCEQLAKKNQLLDIDIAKKQNELVSVDRMLAIFVEERAKMAEAFRKHLLSELPAEADGRNAHEIADLIAAAYDRYIDDIQDGIPLIIQRASQL